MGREVVFSGRGGRVFREMVLWRGWFGLLGVCCEGLAGS